MERKIGEIFEHEGEWYQCVENTIGACWNCDLRRLSCDDVAGECSHTIRDDKKNICFKKLEKVGEPFTCNYYGDNRLLTIQEYQAYDINISSINNIPMYVSNYKHKRIAIELKQNQKDMEEKKSNLKPFSLEAAKAGKPVCTRDGRKARIICFNAKRDAPIIALVTTNYGKEIAFDYSLDGLSANSENEDNDLMMLREKHEGWVNIYKSDNGTYYTGAIFNEKNDALVNTAEIEITTGIPRDCIDTVKISWEE